MVDQMQKLFLKLELNDSLCMLRLFPHTLYAGTINTRFFTDLAV